MTSAKIQYLTGRAVPKIANEQNTDLIVPGRFLSEITFQNMGNYVFYDERFVDGKPVNGHPFNNPGYKGASILVAGADFGCGSSREHAPQALKRYGIKAIIAESFAEIFAGNCQGIGIVGVTVPNQKIIEIARYVQSHPSEEIGISLVDKTISYDGNHIGFDMPEGRRKAFLDGTWDAMTLLQQNEDGIKSVESKLPYLSFK